MRTSRDACTLGAIRREQLDEAVLEALENRVVASDHLEQLLSGMLDRSDAADGRRKALATMRAAKTEAQKAIAIC